MKRIVAVLLMLTMISQFSFVTAFATNETTGKTSLSYTYSKENEYEIVIPASVDLNTQDTISVYANKVSLKDGYTLRVSVDSTGFDFNNNVLALSCTTNLAKYLFCKVYVTPPNSSEEFQITSGYNLVGFFYDGDTPESREATIRFEPLTEATNLVEGEYKGNIYFRFDIEPE